MKTYSGERTLDGVVVTVDGDVLPPRRDLHTFSENNFEWGYEGDESRQLALAILAYSSGDVAAVRYAESFMREIVANFSNEWEINENQIKQAIADLSE